MNSIFLVSTQTKDITGMIYNMPFGVVLSAQ